MFKNVKNILRRKIVCYYLYAEVIYINFAIYFNSNLPLKKRLAYFLFFVLALRPAYKIGYIAYFELNIDYIIETYCINKEKPELKCNGKCHLATQLNTSTPENNDDTSYLVSFFEAFFPVYFQNYNSDYLLKTHNNIVVNNWKYLNTFNSLFIDSLDPPPKV